MAVFVAASDETNSANGLYHYEGWLASESDWTRFFTPAWQERVLDGPPQIPYLHMTEMRSRAWREQWGITQANVDERLDESARVIDQMGSLYPFKLTPRKKNYHFRNGAAGSDASQNEGSLSRQSSWGGLHMGHDRSGQGELKRCTAPGSAGGQQAAAMRLDDRTADGQPHTSPVIFGRKECIEDLFRLLRGKSHTGISDRDQQLSIAGFRPDGKLTSGSHSLHGIDAVEHKVHENLLQ